MLGITYIAALLFSIFGMTMLDYKYKLAFFHDAIRSAIVIGITVTLFIIWDIFGIGLGIFFKGDSPYLTHIMLGSEFPLEELFFLFFLSYLTLVLYRLIERKPWKRI